MNITPLAKTIAAKYRIYEKEWLYVFKDGKVQYLKHAQKTSLANALDTGLIGAIKITNESMTYVRAQTWLNKYNKEKPITETKIQIPKIITPAILEGYNKAIGNSVHRIPKTINRPSYKAKYEELHAEHRALIEQRNQIFKNITMLQDENQRIMAALRKLDATTLINILTNQSAIPFTN